MATTSAKNPDPIAEFRSRLHDALRVAQAAAVEHSQGVWPNGPLIRVKVEPPKGVRLPALLDPVGLVWFAGTGEFHSPLDSESLAQRLGMNKADALAVLEASDKEIASDWRAMLIDEVGKLPRSGASFGSRPSRLQQLGGALAIVALAGLAFAVLQNPVRTVVHAWRHGGPLPTPSWDFFGASYKACEGFVVRRLETPATAEFPGHSSESTRIGSQQVATGWQYDISSYVDAQNQFGAKVRTRFSCRTVWQRDPASGRSDWNLVELQMVPWLAAPYTGEVRQTSDGRLLGQLPTGEIVELVKIGEGYVIKK